MVHVREFYTRVLQTPRPLITRKVGHDFVCFYLFIGFYDIAVITVIFPHLRSPSVMGILVADRKFLGEIGLLDVGMKVYGGENVELGIRVSKLNSPE